MWKTWIEIFVSMINYEFQRWMLTLNQFIPSIDYNCYSFLISIVSRLFFFNLFSLQTKPPPSLFTCYKNWLDTLCGIDPNFHYCILLEKFRFYFWLPTTALQKVNKWKSNEVLKSENKRRNSKVFNYVKCGV